MKTLDQFKAFLKNQPSGNKWSDSHIEKAFLLAQASLSPLGDDSAIPPKVKDPASPGTDITNLDTVHAAILGTHDVLKKMQESQEKYMEMSKAHHSNFDDYKKGDYEWSGKVTKLLGKLVGQPEEDSDDDLKPGDPTYHDPNSDMHDPKMLAELLAVLASISDSQKKITEAQKASSDLIFSLTGKQV